MNDRKNEQFESKFSREDLEKGRDPDKEIDLNVLFPNEKKDLNSLFPDFEIRQLLKKASNNNKDIELIKQKLEEEMKPRENES